MNKDNKSIDKVNCWIIYLMPFDREDRGDYNRVNVFQQECVANKVFGMGWGISCFEYGTPISDENVAIYIEKYNEGKDGIGEVSNIAVDRYKKIKNGDYVIMRLKNGHYYVGRVSSNGSIYVHKEDDTACSRFSWGGTVDKWVEYSNDCEVPSEIAGRFSQRLHSTIQRIANQRQKMLVISMYEKGERKEDRIFDIPKLHIDIDNFARSLTYKELEDLVGLYIQDKHYADGYRLLPSSCKNSQQNYEFILAANGMKPITCQVKNQEEISIDHYIHEKSYEYIYIFSGKWDDSTVSKLKNEYGEYSQIYFISPQELFMTLKEHRHLFENQFYEIDD